MIVRCRCPAYTNVVVFVFVAVLFRKEDIPVVTTKITSILSFLYEKYKIAEAVQPRDHIWQLLVQDSGGSPKVYTQAFIRMVNGNVRLEDNPNIGKAVDCWIIFDTYYNFNFCRQINVQQSDATRFRLKADSEPWNSIAKKHNSSALN